MRFLVKVKQKRQKDIVYHQTEDDFLIGDDENMFTPEEYNEICSLRINQTWVYNGGNYIFTVRRVK